MGRAERRRDSKTGGAAVVNVSPEAVGTGPDRVIVLAVDAEATDAAVAASSLTNVVSALSVESSLRRSRLGLLGDHDFRQLFLGAAGSSVGFQIGSLALPLVAAINLRASPVQMGLVAAGDTVPFVIATLPAGALADWVRRRPLMIACDLGRTAILAVIPLAWSLGALAIWQVVAVAFGLGLLSAVFDVAGQSLLPDLVGKEHVLEANTKLQAMAGISQVGGPTAAGWIIAALSAPYAVGVNALTCLGSAFWLSRIRTPERNPQRQSDANLGRDILDGLRYVATQPLLRAIALESSLSQLFDAAVTSLLLYLLARILHLSAGTIGLFFSVIAVGALTGALLASRIARWVGSARVLWVVPAITGPLWMAVPLLRRGVTLWLVAAAAAVLVGGQFIFNMTQVSFRQRLAPAHLLGRVNATMRFLILGLSPVGSLVGGLLGTSIGVRNTLWIVCTGCALSFIPAVFSPLRTLRDMPEPEDHPG